MTTLTLSILSCLTVLVLLLVVAVNLVRIIRELEAIGGGPTSYLAKIRFGVRAIETQTSHLAPQVTALNEGLQGLGARLGSVENELAATVSNLNRGPR